MKEYPYEQLKDRDLVDIFRFVFQEGQDRQFTKLTATPAVTDVDEREVKVLDTGSGTRRLYTKLDDTLYYIDLTAV